MGADAKALPSDLIATPLGVMAALREAGALTRLYFTEDSAPEITVGAGAGMDRLREELAAYFAGSLKHFTASCAPAGSDFAKAVWREVAQIPYGATRSYRDIAVAIGRPTAVRAVARAISANPVLLIIPCHRVIGANGTLTGYSGGLERKQKLLALETLAG